MYIVPTPDILISMQSDAVGVSNVEIVKLVTGFEVSPLLINMKMIVISVVLAVASAAVSKVISLSADFDRLSWLWFWFCL